MPLLPKFPFSFYHSHSTTACQFIVNILTKKEYQLVLFFSLGLARVELAISSLGNCCSILLSYKPLFIITTFLDKLVPDGSQTRDLRLRRPTLYSTELQALVTSIFSQPTTKRKNFIFSRPLALPYTLCNHHSFLHNHYAKF